MKFPAGIIGPKSKESAVVPVKNFIVPVAPDPLALDVAYAPPATLLASKLPTELTQLASPALRAIDLNHAYALGGIIMHAELRAVPG